MSNRTNNWLCLLNTMITSVRQVWKNDFFSRILFTLCFLDKSHDILIEVMHSIHSACRPSLHTYLISIWKGTCYVCCLISLSWLVIEARLSLIRYYNNTNYLKSYRNENLLVLFLLVGHDDLYMHMCRDRTIKYIHYLDTWRTSVTLYYELMSLVWICSSSEHLSFLVLLNIVMLLIKKKATNVINSWLIFRHIFN